MSALLLGTEPVTEVKLHPVVVLQVLDRALRRAEGQKRVIGTLLGRVEGGVAEVSGSFAVPHLENGDEVAVGRDFHTHMYELHQRVNEGEVVVGWYAAGPGQLDDHSALIHQFYSSVCELPVHLVLDTSLQGDKLDVAAFVSAPLEVVDTALVNQFKQIPVTQKVSEPEAIALNAMAPKDAEAKAAALPKELEALRRPWSSCTRSSTAPAPSWATSLRASRRRTPSSAARSPTRWPPSPCCARSSSTSSSTRVCRTCSWCRTCRASRRRSCPWPRSSSTPKFVDNLSRTGPVSVVLVRREQVAALCF